MQQITGFLRWFGFLSLWARHISEGVKLNRKRIVFWIFWEFSGVRSIWEKINPPPNEIIKADSYKKPATFLLWMVGIYSVLFGIASQRYENRIDAIELRANSVFSLLASDDDNIRKIALDNISRTQNMKCPYKPNLLWPPSVVLSLVSYGTFWEKLEDPSISVLESTEHPIIRFLEGTDSSIIKPLKGGDYRLMVSYLIKTVGDWKESLESVNLSLAKLQHAKLENANLQNAKLDYADLQNAFLRNANLQNAKLSGANLKGAYLEGANLQKATLDEADLTGASLELADFHGSTIRNTKLDEKWMMIWELVNKGGKGQHFSNIDLS